MSEIMDKRIIGTHSILVITDWNHEHSEVTRIGRSAFDLVAPLVMNPAVLRQNNNYPFKTTRNHVWYIAMDEQRVLGFMPVKMTLTNNCIDNYYISGDNSSVIEMLLDRIIHDFLLMVPLWPLYTNATWKTFQ